MRTQREPKGRHGHHTAARKQGTFGGNSTVDKLLVVGCGSIGERHIRCLGSCADVEVTPCDPRAERLEQMQDL